LINEKVNEGSFNVNSNNEVRKAMDEKIGDKISLYIPGCTLEETSGYSDVKIRLDGIPSPRAVKTLDVTGMSIEERKKAFLDALEHDKDAAIKQIMNDFNKEVFKDSKAGIVIIVGFDEKRLDIDSEYVEIDVLIAKVYKNGYKEYLYKPSWWEKA